MELYIDGKLFNETEEEFLNISEYKSKFWKSNGEFHRGKNLPAMLFKSSASGFIAKEFWLNGKRHREGGPAVIWENGRRSWYKNGVCTLEKYTKENSED